MYNVVDLSPRECVMSVIGSELLTLKAKVSLRKITFALDCGDISQNAAIEGILAKSDYRRQLTELRNYHNITRPSWALRNWICSHSLSSPIKFQCSSSIMASFWLVQ